MSEQPASKPDAFGAIDTSLDDVTTGMGMDAPDIDNILPSADLATFSGAFNDGTSGLSFSQMLQQLSRPPAAGPGVEGSVGSDATGTRADVVAYAKKFLGM